MKTLARIFDACLRTSLHVRSRLKEGFGCGSRSIVRIIAPYERALTRFDAHEERKVRVSHTAKRSIEVHALLSMMMDFLGQFFADLGSVRELTEDVLSLHRKAVEPPGSAAAPPLAQHSEEKPWVPLGLGMAALKLKFLKTALRHSRAAVSDAVRGTVEEALQAALTSLQVAKLHLRVRDRQALSHLEAKHDIAEALQQGRLIMRVLRPVFDASQQAMLSAAGAEEESPNDALPSA
jgi:hypothetical protein